MLKLYKDLSLQDLEVLGTATIANLIVNTQTTLTSEIVLIADNIIILNSNVTGTPTENGGIEVKRGTSTNASLLWDETSDLWKIGLAGAEVEISLLGHTHTLVALGLDADLATFSLPASTTISVFMQSILDDADEATFKATVNLETGTDVQAYDATLAALAAYNTNGLVAQTAADTFAGRTITAGSTKVSITNGDGVAGNPTIDVTEANLTLSAIGGAVTDSQVPDTITIANLSQVTTRSHTVLSDIGTNTHAQVDTHIANTSNPHTVTKAQVGLTNVTDEAQIAKSIGTAKGDLISFSASATPVRLGVGLNGQVIIADSAEVSGMKWAALPGGGDMLKATYDPDLNGIIGVGAGGTGLGAIGSANQVLTVNPGGTALEWKDSSGGIQQAWFFS